MTTGLAFWVVILSGVWLIAATGVMLVRPRIALQFVGKMASTNLINYSELTLRLIWGLALVVYAEFAAFPQTFRVMGFVLAVTAIILLLVPRKWHAAYAVFWSNKLTVPLVRFFAPFSLALGIFLIWAVATG